MASDLGKHEQKPEKACLNDSVFDKRILKKKDSVNY